MLLLDGGDFMLSTLGNQLVHVHLELLDSPVSCLPTTQGSLFKVDLNVASKAPTMIPRYQVFTEKFSFNIINLITIKKCDIVDSLSQWMYHHLMCAGIDPVKVVLWSDKTQLL